jgi:hypothetical protein
VSIVLMCTPYCSGNCRLGATGILMSEAVHAIWEGGLLLPTRLFAVNAVRRVERAQSTAGVCALYL